MRLRGTSSASRCDGTSPSPTAPARRPSSSTSTATRSSSTSTAAGSPCLRGSPAAASTAPRWPCCLRPDGAVIVRDEADDRIDAVRKDIESNYKREIKESTKERTSSMGSGYGGMMGSGSGGGMMGDGSRPPLIRNLSHAVFARRAEDIRHPLIHMRGCLSLGLRESSPGSCLSRARSELTKATRRMKRGAEVRSIGRIRQYGVLPLDLIV